MKCLTLAGLLLAALSVGCGSSPEDAPKVELYPFEGIVQVDGQPVSGAQVVLHPKAESSLGVVTPNGVTDESGRFMLTTYQPEDGAPEGAYHVTVSWSDIENPGSSEPEYGPEKLPPRYQNPAFSGLELAVKPGVSDAVVLNLAQTDDSMSQQAGFIND